MNDMIRHNQQSHRLAEVSPIFPIIECARRITGAAELDFLELRRLVGIPVATEIIHKWLPLQSPDRPVWLDFSGVRAINLSVAEELGPVLMKHVADQEILARRYPVYAGLQHNVGYTLHKAFLEAKWTALAYLREEEIEEGMVGTQLAQVGHYTIVALGMLTMGQLKILQYIDHRYINGGGKTSSNDLIHLDMTAAERVGGSARSKRLTELYQRRLLSYEDNPMKRPERLFAPVWRMITDVDFGCNTGDLLRQ